MLTNEAIELGVAIVFGAYAYDVDKERNIV